MLWTVLEILVLCAVLTVVYVYNNVISRPPKVFEAESSPASGAEIDKIIPPEIICDIFSLLDVRSLSRCEQISKYWNYYARSPSVKNFVYNKEIKSALLSNEELKERLDVMDVNIMALKRLKYPADYKTQWHVIDATIARDNGKLLLDTEISGLREINLDAIGDRLLLKFRAKAILSHPAEHRFKTFGSSFRVKKAEVPPAMESIQIGQEYEIITYYIHHAELLRSGSIQLRKIYGLRERTDPNALTRVKEFLPRGSDWPRVLYLLFATSIIRDITNMEVPLIKYGINIVLSIFSLYNLASFSPDPVQWQHQARFNMHNVLFYLGIMVHILLWLKFTHIFTYHGYLLLFMSYIFIFDNYRNYPFNGKITKFVIWMALIWPFFVLEWNAILAAIISGEFISTLLLHSINYVVIILYYTIGTFFQHLVSKSFQEIWQMWIGSDRAKQLMFQMSWSIVIFTLLSPKHRTIF